MIDASHLILNQHVGLGPQTDADQIAVIGRSMGIRRLARNVSLTVATVAETGLPVILTNHGRPVAAIVPLGTTADD
jgi:prevent-host-death family protein